MKIRELEVGKVCNISLVVLSVNRRETKARKPYLALEFFDGVDRINGNYWDWPGKNMPEPNMILDVYGHVTEWQNVKQISVASLTLNKDLSLAEFMPSAGVDIGRAYMDAYALADSIHNDFLRNICLGILEDLHSLWLSAPAAKGVHHAFVAGTLVHSLSVARIAKSIASNIPEASTDLVIAGGLLHDVGKLYGYKIDGISCQMTTEGMMFDHICLGQSIVEKYAATLRHDEKDAGIEALLRHIIISHHGTQEQGSPVTPCFLEAYIVHYADAMDACAEMLREACNKGSDVTWTDKIWALNNKQHIRLKVVQGALCD